MNRTIGDFYSILFDLYEGICWTKEQYGTTVREFNFGTTENFFCINPLFINEDRERPDSAVGRRADANVSCFRNILIEIDCMSLPGQQKYIDELKMPYSTKVFSGGKSFHYIISLEQPCADIEEYRELVFRVLQKVDKADKTAKNPSRLSRAPGAMRDNYCQSLHYVGARISRAALEDWLGPAPIKAPVPKSLTAGALKPTLSIFTKYFLRYGAEEGKWNAGLFKAVCDMVRCGLTEPEISIRLESITGSLTRADRKTIKSALHKASYDAQVQLQSPGAPVLNQSVLLRDEED